MRLLLNWSIPLLWPACALAFSSFYFLSFETPKWLAFNLAGLCVATVLLWRRPQSGAQWEKIPRLVQVGLAFMVIGLGLHFLLVDVARPFEELGQWWAFALIVAFALTIDTSETLLRLSAVNRWALAIFLGLATMQAYIPEALPALFAGKVMGSFSGHHNIASEYVAFSILLLMAHFSRGRIVVNTVLLAWALSYLMILSGRAAMIGMVAAIAVALVPVLRGRWRALVLAVVLSVGFFQFARHTSPRISGQNIFSDDIQQDKAGGVELRLAKWANTLRLLVDHPFGVGAGQFAYRYLDYKDAIVHDREAQELKLIDSPHNAYVQMASDYGVIALAGLLVLLMGFGVALGRKHLPLASPMVLAGLVFIAVDGIFAFPFDIPFLFFATAFLLGFLLKPLFIVEEKKQSPKTWRVATIVVALLALLYYGVRSFASHAYLSTGMTDKNRAHKACEWDPTHWRACVRYGELLGEQGDLATAREVFVDILMRQANHVVALNSLIVTELRMGSAERACPLIERYSQLINDPHKFTDFRHQVCKLP